MCFSPILWFSGAVLSEGYRGVFLLCDPLLPSPLYASGSSCMGVSPALTQDFQMPDSWGTGIQPLLCPPPPHSSPGREAPAWPGSCTASPCCVCVSESCLGLLGSLEVQTGSDRALGKGWWGLLAGVLLWPLTCEPPATLGPPSPSVPAVLSASSSQWVWWLSPATSWRHNSLPLDLRIGSPTHLDFLGEPRGPSPVPFPRAQVLVQSCTPPDCPHSCL